MKFLVLIIFLSIPIFSFADEFTLATIEVLPCYYVVNPIVYGNPVVGGVKSSYFKAQEDLINSNLCFNILKWQVLSEDPYIGEFGKFIYQNSTTNFSRECKYEVKQVIDSDIKKSLERAYNLASEDGHWDYIYQFNEFEEALNNAVFIECEFITKAKSLAPGQYVLQID